MEADTLIVVSQKTSILFVHEEEYYVLRRKYSFQYETYFVPGNFKLILVIIKQFLY